MEAAKRQGAEAYEAMSDTQRLIENRLNQYLAQVFRLTEPQYRFLKLLYLRGELLMSEISRLLLCSRGNATNIRDNLEREGWISRTENTDDRRLVGVFLLRREEFKVIFDGVNHFLDARVILDDATIRDIQGLSDALGQGPAFWPNT